MYGLLHSGFPQVQPVELVTLSDSTDALQGFLAEGLPGGRTRAQTRGAFL